MVVQVVPEGVDEVDGVVSGIGIGVTRKQDWQQRSTRVELKPRKQLRTDEQMQSF